MNKKTNFIFYHNPCSGYFHKVMKLEESFFLTTGMNISLCTSYVNKVNSSQLELQFATNKGYLKVDSDVYSSEISNPKSGGYITDCNAKLKILMQVDKVYTNQTEDILLLSEKSNINKNDLLPVVVVEKCGGIVYCANYHEAAFAIFKNIPYAFLIDSGIKYENLNSYRSKYIKKVNKDKDKF
jgi:hypothetical protein